ncbi:hypothetical protein MKEN_00389500 [Mycena kentingensis (nom. inval.)]|nr:hypothetical protein MKEN_00389500 [Mycena kentingensis (nom. inval.)]
MPERRTKVVRREHLKQSLATRAKRTFDNITQSPRKVLLALSPRKKTRRNKEEAACQSTKSRSSDASLPSPTGPRLDASDDPFLDTNTVAFSVPAPEPPTEAPAFFETQWETAEPSIDEIHGIDASDASHRANDAFASQCTYFQLAAAPSPLTKAAQSSQFHFSYRPPPSVEAVEDEDDRASTPTFHLSPDAGEILRPITPPLAPHLHEDDHDESDTESIDDDDPRAWDFVSPTEFADVAPAHREDDYPRPRAPKTALEQLHSSPDADGIHRRPPFLADARAALLDADAILRGKSRGRDATHEIYGRNGVGYYDCAIDGMSRTRLSGIRSLLSMYVDEKSLTYKLWGESSRMASISMHRGPHCARVLADLGRRFIIDRELLELNPFGKWNDGLLMHEDIKADAENYLASLGRNITAEKLQMFFCSPEFKKRHGIEKNICLRTARRFLHELDYRKANTLTDMNGPTSLTIETRYTSRGISSYRNVFARSITTAFPSLPPPPPMRPDGKPYPVPPRDPNAPPLPRRVVIWYHDESVFYAHDRRHRTWYHKNASAKPQQKGEGHSYMVSDFFSADFGWLKHPWTGRSARVCMKPGANRDGYFTNVEVRAQAKVAVELVNELWPDIDHVFVYHNATTHRKRPDGALSALKMPKAPSGSNPRFPNANLMGQRIKRGVDGKPMYGPDRKVLREPVPMTGAKLPNVCDANPDPCVDVGEAGMDADAFRVYSVLQLVASPAPEPRFLDTALALPAYGAAFTNPAEP